MNKDTLIRNQKTGILGNKAHTGTIMKEYHKDEYLDEQDLEAQEDLERQESGEGYRDY